MGGSSLAKLALCGLVAAGAALTTFRLVVPTNSANEAAPPLALYEHSQGELFLSPGERQTIKHVFMIRNSTPDVWRLQLKGKSCGCTDVTFDSRPVEPGQQTAVQLSFDVPALRMDRHETVELHTNSPSLPVLTCVLRADIFPRLIASIDREIHLTMRPAEQRTLRVAIDAYGPAPLGDVPPQVTSQDSALRLL